MKAIGSSLPVVWSRRLCRVIGHAARIVRYANPFMAHLPPLGADCICARCGAVYHWRGSRRWEEA
jgi:hypothetical protein